MKILALGCLHNNRRLVKRLAKEAKEEGVEVVVITGDLSDFDDPVDGLLQPFVDAGLKILLIAGNHEHNSTAEFLTKVYDNTHHLHGAHHVHQDVGFFGVGGADVFPNILTEKEAEKLLDKAHKSLSSEGSFSKKVIVTHRHPAGTKSEFSGFDGSKAIRKAIEKFKPNLAIHSHIHEAAGMEEMIGPTRVVNVSAPGKILDI